MQTDVDVLIIGAGPAGTMAASMLQREGFRLLVVEKQKFPRFVIGESLLPHCMDLLKEAGLLECVERKNFIQKNGAVFKRGAGICNFDFSSQFTAGWKYTWQVPRAEFDKALADEVASRGVEILYGHGVAAVNFNSHATVTLEQPDDAKRDITAKFVLDCSGFGRVLPRLLDLEKPSNFPVREALFTHVTGDVRPEGREEGKIWITMHPEGAWIWIIPFSDGRTSIGVVAKPEFFARYPENAEERLRAIIASDPNAAPRLAGMKLVFPPQRITGYACGIKQLHGPGYALVGNATEFLDPIFSSGVTLAFASANRAAKVLTRELRGERPDWQKDYSDFVMQGINTFRVYVNRWYDATLPDIFFAAQANPGIMSQVCSVLAGYVWDTTNPYVAQPERALPLLSEIVQGRSRAKIQEANEQPSPASAPAPLKYFREDTLTAYDAKTKAQRIAFAPVVFQSCRILRDSGILELVQKSGSSGLTMAEVTAKIELPRYGIKVLMESGLGIGLFCLNDGRFTLTRLGFFMLRDEMTRVNMEVIHDVCYRGLFDLDQAIATGKPAGLKTLGDWKTFYEALASLPEHARQSWLAFDHFYSDQAFPAALPFVFATKPRRLLDVGGNTGRWAVQCARFDPDVRVTIADLPQQLPLAREAIRAEGLDGRVDFFAADFLDESAALPEGYDAIWMSQFLDCFSEPEIISILRRAARAMKPDSTLYILELFWDRQPNATAAFCLQQTSLYFTAIANGNSQMYHSDDLRRCLAGSGLKIVEERDEVGLYHTLLKCRKA